MEFMGYQRPDGTVGIRNHVLILPTCACASESCRIVAFQVQGSVNVINNSGCAEVKGNEDMTQKILTGFAANPNVYGTVIIGLGCENVPHLKLKEKIEKITNKPVVSFGIQDEGGTINTISKAVRAARQMVADASLVKRTSCDLSALMMGIECGGSDATSGFGANPAVGNLSDRLVDLGASSMMSETIEFVRPEQCLPAVAQPKKSTIKSSRSVMTTRRIWPLPDRTAAMGSQRPAIRTAASPPSRKSRWAASTKGGPAPLSRW